METIDENKIKQIAETTANSINEFKEKIVNLLTYLIENSKKWEKIDESYVEVIFTLESNDISLGKFHSGKIPHTLTTDKTLM